LLRYVKYYFISTPHSYPQFNQSEIKAYTQHGDAMTIAQLTSFLRRQESQDRRFSNSCYLYLMGAKGGYVYILTNQSRAVLYIGVTSNLYARIYEHRISQGSTFTKKYNCTDLVYYHFYCTIDEAIMQEKQLKKWKREWENNLITSFNPMLKDLFSEVSEM